MKTVTVMKVIISGSHARGIIQSVMKWCVVIGVAMKHDVGALIQHRCRSVQISGVSPSTAGDPFDLLRRVVLGWRIVDACAQFMGNRRYAHVQTFVLPAAIARV